MSRQTPTRTVEEICERLIDYRGKTPTKTSSGIRLITAKVIKGGRIESSNFEYIAEDEYDIWMRRGLPQRGDVLVTTEAPLGEVAPVPPDEKIALAQRVILMRPNPTICDPSYLLYAFQSTQVQGELTSRSSGCTVTGIKNSDLRKVRVPLPPLPQQRTIGETLSAYDDLIESNRRRMALLEESARLLYQEWFVRLRFPGYEHSRVIQGLPKGWSRKPLAEIAEFRLGKMLDQKKNRGDLKPYLANVNVRWGSFDLHDLREMRFEDDEVEAYGLKFGDIVMCEGGEPGRCAIWKEQMPGMMIQKALHRIRCLENMNPEYLYQSLRHLGQSGHLSSLFTGATIKHLPREKLEKVTVVMPTPQLLNLFVSLTSPIENQLRLLEAANTRASEARDLLLPRLMNGEIEV